MADPVKPNPTAMGVETSTASTQSLSVTAGSKENPSDRAKGMTINVGGDERNVPGSTTEPERSPEGTPEGDAGDPGAGEDGGGEPEAGGESAPEDLGAFDPADPEVAAKFDERYFTADSKLNTGALEAEWFGNTKEGKGALNEGTYAYLDSRLGLPKAAVDRIAEGLVASNEKAQTTFFEAAGGKDRYMAAIAWAKDSGYTKEQQDRFNAALGKGGADAEDARDALMARFAKSAKAGQQRRGPQGAPEPRAPANPKKDAARGGSGGGAGAVPFKTREEASEAFRKIDPKDNSARAAWRQRVNASEPHIRNR